jgi:hypothetical protein
MMGAPPSAHAAHAAALAKWVRLWEILLADDDPPQASPADPSIDARSTPAGTEQEAR